MTNMNRHTNLCRTANIVKKNGHGDSYITLKPLN